MIKLPPQFFILRAWQLGFSKALFVHPLSLLRRPCAHLFTLPLPRGSDAVTGAGAPNFTAVASSFPPDRLSSRLMLITPSRTTHEVRPGYPITCSDIVTVDCHVTIQHPSYILGDAGHKRVTVPGSVAHPLLLPLARFPQKMLGALKNQQFPVGSVDAFLNAIFSDWPRLPQEWRLPASSSADLAFWPQQSHGLQVLY